MDSLKARKFQDSIEAACYLLKIGRYAEEFKNKMMEKERLQASAVIVPEPETEEFTWDFLVSPRSKIQKNIESVAFGGFNFHSLQFQTGFLAETDHKWGFSIYSNQVNTFISLPKRDRDHRYTVLESNLQFLSRGEVKNTHKLRPQLDETTMAPRVLWASCWVNSDRSWNDTIDTIRVIFKIERETSGKCVLSPASQQIALKIKSVLETVKHVNCEEFFQSEYLSDITLECKGIRYPAHQFILSVRSPVFNRMFRSDMTEVKEGRVVIKDMEPNVLEELLRFIYCSEVSRQTIEDFSMDLLAAADRYDIEPLKVLCEDEMIQKLKLENALEMYLTAELHNAALLKEKAFDIISKNKRTVFPDRETFNTFICKCPDIAYDLVFSCNPNPLIKKTLLPLN